MGTAFFLGIGYLILVSYYLYTSSIPVEKCINRNGESCANPLLSLNTSHHLSLELWIYDTLQDLNHTDDYNYEHQLNDLKFGWKQVDSCPSMSFDLNVTKSKNDSTSSIYKKIKFGYNHVNDKNPIIHDTKCKLRFPNWSRIQATQSDGRKPRVLKAKINLREEDQVIASTTFDLTRIVQRQQGLLIPHYKYSKQPIVIRLILDNQNYNMHAPFRGDGYQMSMLRINNQLYYRPPFEVDDTALKQSSQIELASDGSDRPPVDVKIHLSTISPQRHVFHRLLGISMSMAEQVLSGPELDEIRHFVSDEYLYRFLLTQIIGFVHVYLDYLAFRDEVRFYKGKRNMTGVSASSVVSRFFCDLIILLYLLDGGNTSWLVITSIGSGVALEFWKVCKFFQPTRSSSFPFIKFRRSPNLTDMEKDTIDYDTIARSHLGLMLYPLVVGSAFYAKRFYVYESLYSWAISNLANAVYTFGFISLCPQLYVNYRMKSVAHLPAKVFLYKIFNTFIDDVFAFMIQSPLKHKLMTLRDDIVFVGFLIQIWLYKVDKSRVNEYGYVYDLSNAESSNESTDTAEMAHHVKKD
jgi:hypothetical protein